MAGAYKATPIQNLEAETHVPSLDIYLNKRLADFELRLERIGKIGLQAFLFARKVSRVSTPRCRCSNGAIKTALHIVLDCKLLEKKRQALSRHVSTPLHIHHDFMKSLMNPKTTSIIVRWFL